MTTTSRLDVNGVGTRGSFSRGERIPYNTVKLHLNIEHTAIGDLVVRLNPPSGAPIVISNLAGGSTDNLILTGLPLPTERLGRPNGLWILTIYDSKREDQGRLVSWGLEFSPQN